MNQIHNNEDGKTAPQGGWNEFGHLILAGLLGCLGVALVALSSRYVGQSADVFTREPQVVLDGEWYVGSFSNLGGIIWFGAAAIMSFAACFRPRDRGGLALAALVTWAVGLDDVFMLHDSVYPNFHIRESMVYVAYFGTIGVIVLRCHSRLARSTLVGITIAVFFWFLSAALDRYFNDFGQLAEDGTKFIGIAIWAAAWIHQAYANIAKLARSSG